MALTTWTAYKAAAYQAEQVNKHLWVAKGIGTNEIYVVEVDPVSGGFPITFAGAQGFGDPTVGLRTASILGNATGIADFGAGATSAQTIRVAANLYQPSGVAYDNDAGASGANTLRVVLATGGAGISFSADKDWGTVGPSTLRVAAELGNQVGAANFGAGNSSAQTLRVVVATDQTAIPASQSGTWTVSVSNFPAALSTNAGTSDTSTLRVAANLYNNGTALNYGVGTGGTSTLRVAIDSRSEAAATPLAARLSNGAAFLATDTGATGTDTLRVVLSTRQEAAATPVSSRLSNGTAFTAYGAGTTASDTLRVSANITNNGTAFDISPGTGGTNTLRVAIDTRSEAAATPLSTRPSNGTAFADFGAGTTGTATPRVSANITRDGTALSYNAGAADANTLRVAIATGGAPIILQSGAYVTSTTTEFASVTLSTSTWTTLVASLSAAVNNLTIFSSTGTFLELGIGAAAAETRTLLITPGGPDCSVPVNFPVGSRISVRVVTLTGSNPVPSSGVLAINYIA